MRGGYLAALLGWACSAMTRPGRLDAGRVASVFGVTPGTVRRWVRQGLPSSRIEQLAGMVELPDEELLDRQRRERDEAVRLAREFREGAIAPTRAWSRQGWTGPHRVEVLQLEDRGFLLLARVSRVSDPQDRIRSHNRRYGAVLVDEAVFPSRFVAMAAKHEVLAAVADWRVLAPAGYLERGGTEVWLPGAPRPALSKVRRSLAAKQIGRPRPLKALRRGR